MKARKGRQEVIRDLIRGGEIRTQSSLVQALADQGYSVTQATVSRDVSDLKLEKLPGGIYILREDLHLMRMVSELVLEILQVANFVIVKSQGGSAPVVAAAIDHAVIEGVYGSVSGDNTVLVVADSEDTAHKLKEKLESYLRLNIR
ncbi:MAG: ArgR family transcriptional regulator [Coriobacteriia bacterium]|nr:ArgR family transcriptional regulator [Coriobacteriia bacterium]